MYDTPAPAPAPRKRRRIFRWVFLAIQLLFLVWIIGGVSSASHPKCASLDTQTCSDAAAVGTGIGVLVIVFLWVAVDVILGVGYLIFRRR